MRSEAVAESFSRLRDQKIHPHFAGYLALKRTAARDGRTDDLSPNFKEFFQTFMQVTGGPANRPYLKPFSSDVKLWFNPNVAGSFAPSSVRNASPLDRIVNVSGDGRDARYSFVDRHWELARNLLVSDNQIPALPLAVFLYRDYALLSEEPSLNDVLSVFREEFGYADSWETGEEEYQYLYSENENVFTTVDWFEEL
jgi:hypothetical protein